MGRLLVLIILGISASACATAQARSARAVPLEIPEPPPRTAIEPVSLPEKGAPERSPVATTRPAPAPPPAPSAPAPSAPAPAAAATQPPTTPPAASSVLRPSGSGAQSISARDVREIIDRTSTKLGALNRARLSAGKRGDYDAARRFLSQAQEAAKDNNLMLAYYSAEKAETLVDGLR